MLNTFGFTVSRDVKWVFKKVRGRITKMLQVRIQVSYWNAKEENDLRGPGT